MLTQWFDPEPTFKGLAFAKELARRGHAVEVLTGFPNYPGGKLYDGYKIRFFHREVMDGIPVIRVPLYPSHDGSAFKRIANYVSFALSSAFLGVLLVKPADVMYVYHPPATVGLAAAAISMLRGVPFVYDIQDLWPDTLTATGMLNNCTALQIVDKICLFTYRRAKRLVVLSPGFKERLVERGVPADKVDVIYNWCDEENMNRNNDHEGLAEKLGFAGKFNIVFAGTMGKAQALDAVLDAAALVSDRLPLVRFVFIGGGIEVTNLKQKTEREGLSNVIFLSRRPVNEIGLILNLADVLLVHLRNDALFGITIPSKTQAYLASGKPILMAVPGDASDLIKQTKAGITCKSEDVAGLAAAVVELYNMPKDKLNAMGENGRRFYEKELSLSVGVSKFESLFRMAVNKQ